MADRLLNKVVARTEKRFGRRQSDAYRWLHARHRDLAATFTKHPPCWPDIADTIAAAGILGGRGRPLTGRAVRRIWERVCRDVQAVAMVQVAGIRTRSRPRVNASASWQPTPVAVPVASPAPQRPQEVHSAGRPDFQTQAARFSGNRSTRLVEPLAEAASAADPASLDLPSEGGPLTPEQVRAMKADLQRTLDERSGR